MDERSTYAPDQCGRPAVRYREGENGPDSVREDKSAGKRRRSERDARDGRQDTNDAERDAEELELRKFAFELLFVTQRRQERFIACRGRRVVLQRCGRLHVNRISE